MDGTLMMVSQSPALEWLSLLHNSFSKLWLVGEVIKVLKMQVPVLEIHAHAGQLAYHVPPSASAKHKNM